MKDLNGGMAGPRPAALLHGRLAEWLARHPRGPHCGARSSLGAAFSVMPTAELLSGNHTSAPAPSETEYQEKRREL